MLNTNSNSKDYFGLESISNNVLKELNLLETKKEKSLNSTFIQSKLTKKDNCIQIDNNQLDKNTKKDNSSIIIKKDKKNFDNNPIANSFETGFNIINNKFDSLNNCNYSDLVSSLDSNSWQSDDLEEDIFQYQNDIEI